MAIHAQKPATGLRRLAGVLAVLAGAALLAGCMSKIDPEDLPAYTIVQHEREHIGDDRRFSYLDGAGDQHEFNCEKPDFFSRWKCESADGVVSFEYGVRKSRPRIYELTVDGVERAVERVDSELPGISRVWAPSDAIPDAAE